MGRLYVANTAQFVSLGDIANARFLGTEEWTCCVIFKIATATANKILISKWATSARQFALKIIATSNVVQMVQNLNTRQSTAGLSLDTWYCIGVTCDGAGDGTATVSFYTIDLSDLSFIDDGLNITTGGNQVDQTAPIEIGRMNLGAQEPYDGPIAYVIYVRDNKGRDGVYEFALNPEETALKWNLETGGVRDVQFFMPLGLGSPEPDIGGAGNNGTVSGGLAIGDNPPVGILSADPELAFAGAGAPAGKLLYHPGMTGIGNFQFPADLTGGLRG